MKAEEAWDQTVPFILMGREGGLVRKTLEKKGLEKPLGMVERALELQRVHFNSQSHGFLAF